MIGMPRKLLPQVQRDGPTKEELHKQLLTLNMKYLRMQRELNYIVKSVNKLATVVERNQTNVAGAVGGIEMLHLRLQKHLIDNGEISLNEKLPSIH